jgi:hypothetical protein
MNYYLNILLCCGVDEDDARVGVLKSLDCEFEDGDVTLDYAFIFSKRESARREYYDAVADESMPPLG